MIIVIEGIDRVGKTTLANMLSKKLNYPIFKAKPINDNRNPEANNEAGNMLYTLIEQNIINNFILDRGHFTEYVYGKIDRNYSNDIVLSNFDPRLAKLEEEGKLIFIYVNPESVEWSSEQHGSDLTRHNNLMNVCLKTTKIKNIIMTSFTKLNDTVELIANKVTA